jgi:hypothetical protein
MYSLQILHITLPEALTLWKNFQTINIFVLPITFEDLVSLAMVDLRLLELEVSRFYCAWGPLHLLPISLSKSNTRFILSIRTKSK